MKSSICSFAYDERRGSLLEIPAEPEPVVMEQTCLVGAQQTDISEAAGAKADDIFGTGVQVADMFEAGMQLADIGQESDIDQKQGQLPYIVGCRTSEIYPHVTYIVVGCKIAEIYPQVVTVQELAVISKTLKQNNQVILFLQQVQEKNIL